MRSSGLKKTSSNNGIETLAVGLGWFSIGLGLAELFAPRAVARAIGAQPRTGLLRLMGLREIVAGIGILSQRKPAFWLNTRIAGDAVDLALLGAAFVPGRNRRNRLIMATTAVAGVTALDIISSRKLKQRDRLQTGEVHFRHSVTINRSREELFAFWRNFENLVQLTTELESVRNLDQNRSRWVAGGPAGTRVEWDAEIYREKPNELITWRSLSGPVNHVGTVRFDPAPGKRGTTVKVEMQYHVPVGLMASPLVRLLGYSPEKHVKLTLQRFKQLMETGEIARTEGQPAGRKNSLSAKFDQPVPTPAILNQ
jgi:uncharacterized membrane protein